MLAVRVVQEKLEILAAEAAEPDFSGPGVPVAASPHKRRLQLATVQAGAGASAPHRRAQLETAEVALLAALSFTNLTTDKQKLWDYFHQ